MGVVPAKLNAMPADLSYAHTLKTLRRTFNMQDMTQSITSLVNKGPMSITDEMAGTVSTFSPDHSTSK